MPCQAQQTKMVKLDPANLIAPEKRMLSSMTPTIVTKTVKRI